MATNRGFRGQGRPSAARAYAREEVQDALVDDAVTLGGEYNDYSTHTSGATGGPGMGMDRMEQPSSLRNIPNSTMMMSPPVGHSPGHGHEAYHHHHANDGHNSVGSLPDMNTYGSGDNADLNAQVNQPSYLFSVIEEALPKQADVSRQLSTADQQQRREQVEHTWEKVRRWLWTHTRDEDRRAAAYVRGQADATCLHLMCKLHNLPEDILQAMVDAAPDVVSWTDTHGWLPLHHACANGASPEVLKILIDAYPAGKLTKDDQSRTPLHFYVTRSSDNVAAMTTNAELLADTGAAGLADLGGMLPMHYACAYGTHPAVLQVLAMVDPSALTAKEKHGRTPMHLAMVNAHRDASPSTIRFLLSHSPSSKDTINKRDKDGYLPLHLLALSLKGYRMDEPEKRFNVRESLSMYLKAEPIPTADFLTAIQDLPDWLLDTAVVSNHVRNVLNEKIVKRFPTSILMLDGYLRVVWIVCFALCSKNHIDMLFEDTDVKDTSQSALIVLFVASVYFIFRELIQVASLISLGSFSSWWKDAGNWLDVIMIVLVTYYAVLMAIGDQVTVISNEAFRGGVAFTQGLLWVSIIMFLKNTLVDFAVFVGGVFYVVKRLLAFLLAVGVILLAFAQMFYFIYIGDPVCEDFDSYQNNQSVVDEYGGKEEFTTMCSFKHCTFPMSLLQVYSMMTGEINDETRYSKNTAAQILFVIYGFLVVILLSNVLIAVVTDSYEIIQNDRAAIVFWCNRLNFVAEMDAITYAIQRRFKCMKGGKKGGGQASVATETREGVNDSNNDDRSLDNSVEGSTDYFREGWHQVMTLFDDNLYDEVDWIEAVVYNIFRFVCILLVIPLWLLAGAITAGWLWPPQVRESMFVQKDTSVSRAELERQKLEQLHDIQDALKALKQDIKHEMSADREEILRMRNDVETIQGEVLSDLQQVRELMSSLLVE